MELILGDWKDPGNQEDSHRHRAPQGFPATQTEMHQVLPGGRLVHHLQARKETCRASFLLEWGSKASRLMMIGAGTICYICIYTHIIHMYTYVIYTCY